MTNAFQQDAFQNGAFQDLVEWDVYFAGQSEQRAAPDDGMEEDILRLAPGPTEDTDDPLMAGR